MGLVIRNDDPSLLQGASPDHSSDVTIAPFTLVLMRVPISGMKYASHIMNAVLLSAVLSAGNSAIYAASRTLMSLADDNKAPHIFSKLTKQGVPLYALTITTMIGCLAFLGIFIDNGVVFSWLIRISGVSGLLTWLSICVIHLRFRWAWIAQGRVMDLPYIAPFFPIPHILVSSWHFS